MLSEDVPRLMSMIPQEEHAYLQLNSQTSNNESSVSGNTIFNDEKSTPFEIDGIDGIKAGLGEQDWIVERSRHEYDQVFAQLSPQNGKISGATAKQEMVKSKLVNSRLSKKIFFLDFCLLAK
jgi:EH domain-containing protein 1